MSPNEMATCPQCGGPMPYLSSCQKCGYLPGDEQKSESLGKILGGVFGLFILAVLFGNFGMPFFFPDPTIAERIQAINQLIAAGKIKTDEKGGVLVRRQDWDAAMGKCDGAIAGDWHYDCRGRDGDQLGGQFFVNIQQDITGKEEWLRIYSISSNEKDDDPDGHGPETNFIKHQFQRVDGKMVLK